MNTSRRNGRTIPADIRQMLVRQLGAALAAAWQREHDTAAHDNAAERGGHVTPSRTISGMADEKPWFALGHVDSLPGNVCTPRPREALWTLVKGGKRVDAELLFHGELGVEVQCLYDGVMAYGRRFILREQAVAEGEVHRRRLMRDGWIVPG